MRPPSFLPTNTFTLVARALFTRTTTPTALLTARRLDVAQAHQLCARPCTHILLTHTRILARHSPHRPRPRIFRTSVSGWARAHRLRTLPRAHRARTHAHRPLRRLDARSTGTHTHLWCARTHPEPMFWSRGELHPLPSPASGIRPPATGHDLHFALVRASRVREDLTSFTLALASATSHHHRHRRPSPHSRPPGAAAAGV